MASPVEKPAEADSDLTLSNHAPYDLQSVSNSLRYRQKYHACSIENDTDNELA